MIQRPLTKCLLLLSLCLVFVFTSVSAATPAAPVIERAPDITLIQKNGVLRVAFLNSNMPPFFMRDANNNWSGIEIELAQMIANELKVKLVIVPAEKYNDIIDMVANGKADIGMGLLSITPERELRITFTYPYYSFQRHLLVNRVQAAQNGWNLWQVAAQMQTTTKPISIGALANSAQTSVLQGLFPNAKIVIYPTVTEAMQAVVAGKVFAAMGNSPVQVRDFLQHNPKANLTAEDVVITNASVDYVAAALPWQYFYFKQWLDLYFDYLKQNGIEDQLFQKYNQPVEAGNEFAYP